jgi:hypothetical protein
LETKVGLQHSGVYHPSRDHPQEVTSIVGLERLYGANPIIELALDAEEGTVDPWGHFMWL